MTLTPHPSTLNQDVRRLGAQLRVEKSGLLVIEYSLEADMSRIRIPPSGAGGRADALWKHTCFEGFLAPANRPCYGEFNFSPSLEWAIYGFNAHREGMSRPAIGRPPEISVRRAEDGLELRAQVHLGDLDDLRDARHLRIALAAVIEDNDGRLSYWALRHPPGKPDFHHPNSFVLELVRS